MGKEELYLDEKRAPPESKRRVRKWLRERRVRILKTASYAAQIVASAFIVLAWASDGDRWAYVNVHGFSVGGRGSCDGPNNCSTQYYTEVPEGKVMGNAPGWGPIILLWLYLVSLFLGILYDLYLTYKEYRKKQPYYAWRSAAMFTLAGVFSLLLLLAVIWVWVADAEYEWAFWMTVMVIPLTVLAGFLYHILDDKQNEGKVKDAVSKRRRFWKFMSRCTGFIARSQFLSIMAAGFYIGVNTLIMIHDFNAPEVQGYIHNEIAPMFNGDPDHAFAHPEFYGDDKSCSHFPVSNIVAQGKNVEPLIFFFIYHLGICFISFFMIVDEMCDVRFGILGPQQNKTGAAWTSFYLFTATMSRSIVFWSRGFVMLTNTLSWIFLAIAGYNIIHHYVISKCYGPKVRGVDRGDRHAALRVAGLEPVDGFRGPLQLPLVGRYLGRLQRAVKDGDGTLAMRGPMRGTKATKVKIRRDIDAQLGRLSLLNHYPDQGGFVGKPPPTEEGEERCVVCEEDGSCLRISKVFFRGFPYHRKDNWGEMGKGFFVELALDLRRLCCMICAFLLFLVQFCLCFSELAPYARWQFRSQYANNKAQWVVQESERDSGRVWGEPLLPTECSYFKWSGVPVTYVGDRNLDAAVLTSVTTVGLNKTFLMGMCISIMLVSYYNQRYWGQSLPGLFSLIGPRLSSISVGMTLIHVAVCTASQSLFADRLVVYYIAKGIVYTSLIVGVLACLGTEDFDTYGIYQSTKKGSRAGFRKTVLGWKARKEKRRQEHGRREREARAGMNGDYQG